MECRGSKMKCSLSFLLWILYLKNIYLYILKLFKTVLEVQDNFNIFSLKSFLFVFLQETTSYTGRGKTCTGFLCTLSCKKLFSSSSCYQNLFTFLMISILWFSETLFPQTLMQRVLYTGCLEEKCIISNYFMYSLGLLNSLLPFGMVSR